MGLTLATPVAIAIAIAIEFTDCSDLLRLTNHMGKDGFQSPLFITTIVVGVAGWWFSQMWLGRHIWVPANLRLERVDG